MNLRSRIVHLDLILITVCLSVASAHAQDGFQKRLKFEHITVEDGLAANRTWDVLQDSKGFMWFATSNGVNRYDGYNMKLIDRNETGLLKANAVWSLMEDERGRLWIGANGGGLSRYDRATQSIQSFFETVRKGRIGGQTIRRIHASKQTPGLYWVAVHGRGLSRMTTSASGDMEIVHFDKSTLDPNAISSYGVSQMYEDRNGTLWLGTGLGVVRLDSDSPGADPQQITFTKFTVDSAQGNERPFRHVDAFLEDRYGRLWTAGQDGLGFLDPAREKIIIYAFKPELGLTAPPRYIRDMLEDRDGHLWLASTREGLYHLRRKGTEIVAVDRYTHDPDDPLSLSSDDVRSICEDRNGALWAATFYGGINKSIKSKFTALRHEPNEPNSLVRNNVTAVWESEAAGERYILVGTREGGVTRIRFRGRREPEYTHYQHDPNNRATLSGNSILAIRESLERRGKFWIGLDKGGLNELDVSTGHVVRYNEQRGPDIARNVRQIYESPLEPGVLWLGANGGGLMQFDSRTQKFTSIQHRSNNFLGSALRSILQIVRLPGSPEVLSVRAGQELYGVYPSPYLPSGAESSESFNQARLRQINMIERQADSLLILRQMRRPRLHPTKDGEYWYRTRDGLAKFDEKSQQMIFFGTAEGLPHSETHGMLEDDHGNFWIGTNNGLARFDRRTNTFKSYDVSDGLSGNGFVSRSFHKGRSGRFYFGTTNGLTIFHPDSVQDNTQPPQVAITEFTLLGEEDGERSNAWVENMLRKNQPAITEHLNLPYAQNGFTIEFAALDYTAPEKNRYAYRMDGLDDMWVSSGNRRFATYNNLAPGDYVFRVKGSDGVWNETGASMKITILPPWWRTGWAYAFYAFLGFALFYALRRNDVKRRELRHEAEMRKLEAEKFQELDHLKSGFFANISHEFRTPLTLIMGQIESVKSTLRNHESDSKLSMALRNAKQLLNLINQLLDLSKLEARKMQLSASTGDMLPLLKSLTYSFESLADQKKIDLQFECESDHIYAHFDQEKIERIMYNLLSNAVKFTPEGGRISVLLAVNSELKSVDDQLTDHSLQITVRDSGMGIPQDRLPHIFDRFYQVDASQVREHEGTGIGLALVKELVELHRGKISVESAVGFGATFTVQLPVINEQLPIEGSLPERGEHAFSPVDDVVVNAIEQPAAKSQEPTTDGDFILIVEDNPDVRAFVRQNLQDDYRLIEAENGEEGFTKAHEYMPDLIISDVMMPKVDGYELARRLRADEATNHIPIIMLTAKAAEEEKIEGLESGVDAYLLKPFSTKELQVRVRKLIERQKQLATRLAEATPQNVRKEEVSPAVREFLERLNEIVEEHLADEDFQVDQLCRKIGLSRRQLQRKLKSVLDCSPAVYMRRARLERAKELLLTSRHTVSEVSFMVGYGDVSAFARAFREAYQKPPSEFLKS